MCACVWYELFTPFSLRRRDRTGENVVEVDEEASRHDKEREESLGEETRRLKGGHQGSRHHGETSAAQHRQEHDAEHLKQYTNYDRVVC